MKIIRTAIVAALALTLGCDASTSPTTPVPGAAKAPAFVVDGSMVHLTAYSFAFYGDIQAGSRMIVVSYEPIQYTLVIAGITYPGIVHVVHPRDGGYPVSGFFTDTPLERGTMLEANGIPLTSEGTFPATVIGHGASQ
jgi:hypothetical protein